MTNKASLIRGCATLVVALAMLVRVGAQAPCVKGNAPGETFEVRGLASSPSGAPFASLNLPGGVVTEWFVVVFPFAQPNGEAVTRYFAWKRPLAKERPSVSIKGFEWAYRTGDEGPLAMSNPIAKTEPDGGFVIKVSEHLFMDPCQCATCQGYNRDELGLGIFRGNRKSLESLHEIEVVKMRMKARVVDAGKILFKPVSAPVK